jgi:lipopolysaccharide export system protein LptA
MRLSIAIFLLGLFSSLMASAQVVQGTTDTLQNGNKIIQILAARELQFLQQDSAHNFTIAVGNVRIKQERTLFYADSVVVNRFDNSMEAFGNIHINDADSVHTYAQYLKYIGNTKKAQLRKKVRLTDGSGTLTTEELDYEVSQKIGVYRNGGKLVNKKTTLTSEQANYYGDTRDVIFTRKVVLVDPEYTIRTDTLQYNTQTESIRLSSPTRIVDSSKRIILTRNAYFDRKNKKGFLYERSQIIDTAYTFTADDMALDDSTGRGEFRGNAVYRSKDSTEGFDLIANNIKVDRKKDILLATIQPLLLIKQKGDTTFVAADTLYVARLIDLRKTREVPVIRLPNKKDTLLTNKKVPVDTTAKYFEAYSHVKVYADSLQGVGDSLFYASDDSTFRFFKSPVIWAKDNQILGDTIYLFLKNRKPELLTVFENALAINKIDSTFYFNQLRGTRMQAFFEDGEMYFMSAKGSAENVYYFQDEQKHFISVNKSTCDVINIYLENNKPQKVSFLNKYEGTAYPMRKADHEGLKLRKFKWLDSIRPKSKADLLQYAPVVIPLAEKNTSNDTPKNN